MMRPKARRCHATHMMASCRDWNMVTSVLVASVWVWRWDGCMKAMSMIENDGEEVEKRRKSKSWR